MKKQFTILGLLLLFTATTVQSQDYTTAVGVKFYPGAFSFKHFVTSNAAIEGLVSFWGIKESNGSRITGLYEVHNSISGAEGLSWYYGGGAHFSIYAESKTNSSRLSPGIDGVIGLDIKFRNAPINISLDWQPSVELGNYEYNRFISGWGGLALRYTF
jgi:hypothetical protein